MRQSDFIKAITKALRDGGMDPVFPRRLSHIDKREGIVVRPMPARSAVEYIDGTREVEQGVRVICKRREAIRAMTAADDALDILDGLRLDVGGTEVTVTCSGDRAFELELNDSDYTVWEARATALYTIRGGE